MRTHIDEIDPADLATEVRTLRGLVDEKEQAFRRAQERINIYERDWLYATCSNFRGTIARCKTLKQRVVNRSRLAVKFVFFVLRLVFSPLRSLLRMFGLSRRTGGEKGPAQSRIKVGLTDPLPETIVAGRGNSFLVGGWVFHPHRRIAHLELRLLLARPEPKPGTVLDGEFDDPPLDHELPAGRQVEFSDCVVPVTIRNLPNRQVLTEHFPAQDPTGNSFWSGYQALVSIPPQKYSARAQLMVRAYLDNGVIETVPLGKLTIQPQMPAPRPIVPVPAGQAPLVAICMTTYNPPPELFRRQIESIRKQTHTRWVCIIRDDGSKPEALRMIQATIAGDARFVFRENAKNLGFYKNFEAALADVPEVFDFVALSDQDDRWHADKLESLLRHFTPGTTLVYSDMNIADETGRVWANTYWTTRDNNFTHFPTLLLANTITGAASMFRRNLLDYLLPFPERTGDAYHDHWLGCVAMAVGRIQYVPRPLYDYVQHNGNVVGHVAPQPGTWFGCVYRFFGFFHPLRWSRNVPTFLRHGRGFYFADLVRIQHTARNVLQRCAQDATPDKQAALVRMLTMADTWSGKLWLALRPFQRRDAWRLTVGVEAHLLQALCWSAHLRIKSWWGTRLTARGLLRGVIGRQRLAQPHVIDHIDTVAALTRITAPLSLGLRNDAPPRVNVVISIIDFKYVFGGYITVFHLCRKLVKQGFHVRLVVTDECDFRPVTWADSFRNYPGLEDFLERIELVYAFDRHTVVPVGPRDTFLATSWWTAHIAHQATRALGKQKFVYLIQEYEPGFYPFGTLAASTGESYSFPHYALFSTEILRDYFRHNGCGVFAGSHGDQFSVAFQNAITAVGPVTAAELRAKRTRKLLFYCRPEAHALRNMYDTGIMALRNAVQAGAFRGWDIHGIGSMGHGAKIKLADGVFMDLLPRLDQESYRKILKDYDVGLSLMCSPHPSLVPLEMAKAGMSTVTNTFANKTADRLLEISSNFLPTPASVEGVTMGLFHAAARTKDYEARARGANVKWATTWNEAFPPEFMGRIGEFIRAAMEDAEIDATALRRAA